MPVKGALAMVISMRELGFSKFIIADENKDECAIISDVEILPFKNLNGIVSFLNKESRSKRHIRLIFQS